MTVLPHSAVNGRHADPEAAADLDLAVRIFLQGPTQTPHPDMDPVSGHEAVHRLVERLLRNGPEAVLAIRWAVLRYERCPSLATRIEVIDAVIEAGLPSSLNGAGAQPLTITQQEQS